MPAASTQKIEFDGKLLERGFWLYIWEIKPPRGKSLYYVGRTGDSSSPRAQSPFNRMGQHLGFAEASNTLRKQLKKRKLTPETCSFRLVAHGPVLPEGSGMAQHSERRDIIAALEKKLADAMEEAGYDVLNKVDSRKAVDQKLWRQVKKAFAVDFPKLESVK
jgi:hypothetical protein